MINTLSYYHVAVIEFQGSKVDYITPYPCDVYYKILNNQFSSIHKTAKFLLSLKISRYMVYCMAQLFDGGNFDEFDVSYLHCHCQYFAFK